MERTGERGESGGDETGGMRCTKGQCDTNLGRQILHVSCQPHEQESERYARPRPQLREGALPVGHHRWELARVVAGAVLGRHAAIDTWRGGFGIPK